MSARQVRAFRETCAREEDLSAPTGRALLTLRDGRRVLCSSTATMAHFGHVSALTMRGVVRQYFRDEIARLDVFEPVS